MSTKHMIMMTMFILLTGLACNLLPLVGQDHSAGIDEDNEVQMGALYRSESGGFTFLTLPGYDIDEVQGRVSMFPTPSDEQSGPYITMIGRLAEEDITLAQALNYTPKANSSSVFSETEDIIVQGLPAISVFYTRPYHAIDGVILDYYGADEGEEIQGWFVLVEVSPGHIFRLEMFAPSQQWQELLPSFESLLESLRFTE
ncbi:MAG TPA: hypothetical protein ENN32_07305 [Chloroflexi bacterium]|nr:hypothetical protein [Chloroflexota bacterium]